MELNCRFGAHRDDGGVAFEQEFHQRPHDYSNLLISGHYFIIKITFKKLVCFRGYLRIVQNFRGKDNFRIIDRDRSFKAIFDSVI